MRTTKHTSGVQKIEFSGVPGSGKTTIARRLMEESRIVDPMGLQARVCTEIPLIGQITQVTPGMNRVVGKKIFDRVVGRTIEEVLAARPMLREVVTAAVDLMPGTSPKCKEDIIYWTLQSHAISEIADEVLSPGDIFVNDEGTVHRATTLYAGGGNWRRNRDEIRAYMKYTAPIRLLIHVDAPNKVCTERMEHRPKGLPRRLKGSSVDDVEEFLDASRNVTEMAVGILSRQDVRILRVDTERETIEDNLEKIRRPLSVVTYGSSER